MHSLINSCKSMACSSRSTKNKHAAIIFSGGKIVSKASNTTYITDHAEFRAIKVS